MEASLKTESMPKTSKKKKKKKKKEEERKKERKEGRKKKKKFKYSSMKQVFMYLLCVSQ
jgi:hypothetical protein